MTTLAMMTTRTMITTTNSDCVDRASNHLPSVVAHCEYFVVRQVPVFALADESRVEEGVMYFRRCYGDLDGAQLGAEADPVSEVLRRKATVRSSHRFIVYCVD